MATCSITAGLLIRRPIRNALRRFKFKHVDSDFEWLETKGFWESTFTLRGDYMVLRDISSQLEAHFNED